MAYFSKILSQKKIGFSLRKCDGKFGPVISDLGNLIFDVDFSLGIVDDLKMISGVIEHGFVQKKMYNYEIYTIN